MKLQPFVLIARPFYLSEILLNDDEVRGCDALGPLACDASRLSAVIAIKLSMAWDGWTDCDTSNGTRSMLVPTKV